MGLFGNAIGLAGITASVQPPAGLEIAPPHFFDIEAQEAYDKQQIELLKVYLGDPSVETYARAFEEHAVATKLPLLKGDKPELPDGFFMDVIREGAWKDAEVTYQLDQERGDTAGLEVALQGLIDRGITAEWLARKDMAKYAARPAGRVATQSVRPNPFPE